VEPVQAVELKGEQSFARKLENNADAVSPHCLKKRCRDLMTYLMISVRQ